MGVSCLLSVYLYVAQCTEGSEFLYSVIDWSCDIDAVSECFLVEHVHALVMSVILCFSCVTFMSRV